MGALLGISAVRVRELSRRGVFKSSGHGKWDPAQVVPAYCESLRKTAAGRASSDGEGLELTAERAKLARAQRIRTELQIAAERGALVSAQDVARDAAQLGTVVIAGLYNLPSRVSDSVAGMRSGFEIDRTITREIDLLVNDIRASLASKFKVTTTTESTT